MKSINTFKHRIVRDLAWVIASPPLISGHYQQTNWWNQDDCANEFNACYTALKALDNNPAPLINHLNQLKSGRLGLRFEAFIAYWLAISPNFSLLAQNIQVIKEGHTYGEADFIIKNEKTEKIIHLEVALKFYLGTPPYADSYRWFGTNTQDQLGKKFDHLKTRQTQLCKDQSNFFKDLGFVINEQHCILKGRLFYPASTNKISAPEIAASNHLKGIWIQSPQSLITENLYSINKTYWMAELVNDDIDTTVIKSGFTASDYPQCYVDLIEDDANHWFETQRIFYLPECFSFPKEKSIKNKGGGY